MKKWTKTAIKIFAVSFVGLAAATFVLFIRASRKPTTQLIDATGKELTAGNVLDRQSGSSGRSVFDDVHALIKDRKFKRARDRLLQIIDEDDLDGEACMMLCDVSRDLKELEAATDYGLKAVTLLPNNAEAHLAYARALGAQLAADMQSISGLFGAITRLGLFKSELNRAIELDPEDTQARTMLVFANLVPAPIGDVERAIELCKEIEKRDPISAKQLLAACYRRKDDTERAITLLLEGTKEYPDENSFHAALADIYAEQKRFDEADAAYDAARQGKKNDAYYRALYGQARMRIQNKFEPERAIELLDEFITAKPEDDKVQSVAHACWRKGNALEQLGRKEDARKAYEESLRWNPDLKVAKKALDKLADS